MIFLNKIIQETGVSRGAIGITGRLKSLFNDD